MDREKVIKAVEEAFDLVHSDFIGTDDFNETEWEQNKADAISMLKEQEHKDRMYHALEDDWKRLKELLKEQEAVEPKIAPFLDASRSDGSWFYICGACSKAIDPNDKYCRWCGRPVKWE